MLKRTLLYRMVPAESATEKLEDIPADVLHLGVPLFIRLCEYSREDAKDDEDLHRMTERLTLACKGGTVVGMEVYGEVTDTVEPDKVDAAAEDMRGEGKYGDVKYADTKNKKYPVDTKEHVRAAWSYIHQKRNAAKYSEAELSTIKANIKHAAKEFGIELHEKVAVEELTYMIEHLNNTKSAIIKHGISPELMKAIDHDCKFVEMNICCDYEAMGTIPEEHFDPTIDNINNELKRLIITKRCASREGIIDKIKDIFTNKKEKMHSYEPHISETAEELKTIKAFDETKFEAMEVCAPSKKATDEIVHCFDRIFPIIKANLIEQSADKLISLLKQKDPNIEKHRREIALNLGNHYKVLNTPDVLNAFKLKVEIATDGEYIGMKAKVIPWGYEKKTIKVLGWKIADLKRYYEKIEHLEKDVYKITIDYDESITSRFQQFEEEFDKNNDTSPDGKKAYEYLSRLVDDMANVFYFQNTFELVSGLELWIHDVMLLAVKCKKE